MSRSCRAWINTLLLLLLSHCLFTPSHSTQRLAEVSTTHCSPVILNSGREDAEQLSVSVKAGEERHNIFLMDLHEELANGDMLFFSGLKAERSLIDPEATPLPNTSTERHVSLSPTSINMSITWTGSRGSPRPESNKKPFIFSSFCLNKQVASEKHQRKMDDVTRCCLSLEEHYAVILNVGLTSPLLHVRGRKGTSEERTMWLLILLKD